jgi:hypothetical protein
MKIGVFSAKLSPVYLVRPVFSTTFELFIAWIKTQVKFPEKCPRMAAKGGSTERVILGHFWIVQKIQKCLQTKV